ncbi:MAG: acetyl-CoA hydrolase/transferase C-terminal domain-containing protein [Lysobacterales bacterium]
MPEYLATLDDAVDRIVSATADHVVLAAPLGIGKPHRLINALYARVAADPAISLQVLTALSLTPPKGASDLERRFLDPFVARHFGTDFPALDYVAAMQGDALPANITVEEFYLQSGVLLGSRTAQRSYMSVNYTHVARTVAERGVNALVQKVAREPGGTRLSLSSNPDLTFDLVDACDRIGAPRPLLVAEIDPELPWLDGPCAVAAEFFDVVLELPGPTPQLFALPRQPVSDAEYAIGLYASALVRDGGTLQIGIGALSDALCHALVLRHTRNDAYRAVLRALDPDLETRPCVISSGGLDPFAQGLYGASEMVNDGFRLLMDAGVLRRRVVDDLGVMQRLDASIETVEDSVRLEREGRVLDGAFYLGSKDLYRWLRELPAEVARTIGMTRVSHINELYGGNEALERLQRRDARFFNTCMLMTALGAAASDALDDGRVVSGVGGQYNFVAMAHALHDARSVIMFRAIRDAGAGTESSLRWSYGHTTIPRHLRDIAITEYGIADLRGATDESCVVAMLDICDVRFEPALRAQAIASLKLAPEHPQSSRASRNSPVSIGAALAPFRGEGTLPEYPAGCDFTDVEQRLVRALGWLKAQTRSPQRKVRTLLRAVLSRDGNDPQALQRMALIAPGSPVKWMSARLLAHALHRTATRAV